MRNEIRCLIEYGVPRERSAGAVVAGRLLASIAATAGLDRCAGSLRAGAILMRWARETGAEELAVLCERALEGVRPSLPRSPYLSSERRALALHTAISIMATRKARPDQPSREIDLTWTDYDREFGVRVRADGVQALVDGGRAAMSNLIEDFTDEEWPWIHARLMHLSPWLAALLNTPHRDQRLRNWTNRRDGHRHTHERWLRLDEDETLIAWEPAPERVPFRDWGNDDGDETLGFCVTSLSAHGLAQHGLPPRAVFPVPLRPMGWAHSMHLAAQSGQVELTLTPLGPHQPRGLRGVIEHVRRHRAQPPTTQAPCNSIRFHAINFGGASPPAHHIAAVALTPEVLLARAASLDQPWTWVVKDAGRDILALTRWMGDSIETIGLPRRLGPLPAHSIDQHGIEPPPMEIPDWLLDELFAWCRAECADGA